MRSMSFDGRRGWMALAAALVLLQAPASARTALDPAQSDFINYLAPAARLSRGESLDRIYERREFERAAEAAGVPILGSFVPHPPSNALWLLPFATWSPSGAKLAWTVVLWSALVTSAWLLTRAPFGLPGSLATVVVFLPTLAVRNGLAFGQPYAVLGLFLIAGTVLHARGQGLGGAFLLGLGASFKPYAAPIGFLFARRGGGRALTAFVFGVALPIGLTLALSGPEVFVRFGERVLPWMMRGDIQDPFAPGWASAMALANRLFRFEPDLNPSPWFVWPAAAKFVGSGASALVLALSVIAARRACVAGRFSDACGIVVCGALAASPFAASYHLILLALPIAVTASRFQGRPLALWLAGCALVGSPAVNWFRSADGLFAPFAYLRFFCLVAMTIVVAWPHISRRGVVAAALIGFLSGSVALVRDERREDWPRVQGVSGYAATDPRFCDGALHWSVPSSDGRRWESRGEGRDCPSSPFPAAEVFSKFENGSWNVYWRPAGSGPASRLTASDANEVEPALTPDGCAVVFASDQGRGLGSTALFRISLSRIKDGCAGSAPAAEAR